MKLLCIEGSTDDWSVAIVEDGNCLAAEYHNESNKMAALLAVAIKNVLENSNVTISQLDAIAIGAGPGSYTGLRIVASTAKGICMGANLPLLAVNSLKALALDAIKNNQAEMGLAMMDARRNDVFAAIYNYQGKEIWPPRMLTIEKDSWKMFPDGKIALCGNGIYKIADMDWPENFVMGTPKSDALHLFEPAYQQFVNKSFENLASFSPFYLLPPNITSSKKKLI